MSRPPRGFSSRIVFQRTAISSVSKGPDIYDYDRPCEWQRHAGPPTFLLSLSMASILYALLFCNCSLLKVARLDQFPGNGSSRSRCTTILFTSVILYTTVLFVIFSSILWNSISI
jgi:hypothetical protein